MLQRIQSFFALPAPFDPIAPLDRLHPILQRELALLQGWTPQRTFANDYFNLTQFAVILHLPSLGVFCFSTGIPWQTVLLVSLPTLLVSMGVEIFTSARTVLVWHTAGQREALDLLRLTMRDDDEFLNTYATISTVRSWAAYQLEMAMRVIPAILLGGLGGAMVIGGVVSSPMSISQPLQVLVLFAAGICLMRVAILFITDPTLRFRANIIWSLLCAISYRDSASAVAAAVVGGLCVRLLHLAGLMVAGLMVFGYLYADSNNPPEANQLPLILIFTALAVRLPPFTHWIYSRLYAWLRRRTLFALGSGET